ncbi:16 kDa beta-galactoside-binding lectin-like [Hemicordylus capensis]|uniref:16 kDa beta-galactoside-binding lectin-like n=1 Tax=Hemicordylus capensis TaxID=884348 RepID=UPI0023024198|nr:16 kDa beta-galactoside-binding lectin-like [Hemicordylus capensis]
MENVMTVNGLNIQPGERLQLMGRILPDAEQFVVDLGKDSNNLVLHFNPRFFSRGDSVETIICNSKQDGVWGEKEEVHISFPMLEKIKIIFTFRASELQVEVDVFKKVQLEGDCLKILEPPEVPREHFPDLQDTGLIFPNRTGLKAIQFVSVHGDFKIEGFKLLCPSDLAM